MLILCNYVTGDKGDVNSHRGCSDGQLTAGIRGQLEIGLCVSCFLNFSPAD